MKKFKIKEQEIFANSLHDALEIYKHKVKDKEEEFKPGDKVRYHAFGFSGWHPGIVTAKKETRYGTRYDLRLSGGFEKTGIPAEYLEKIRDSKSKDSKVKDAQIDIDFWSDYDDVREAKKDAQDFAKSYNCKVVKFRQTSNSYQVVFEGTEQNLKKLLKGGGYDAEDYEDFKIKDSKLKDANWNSHVDLSDYLHDVLDDENIDYVSIGIDFVTFDNIDDLEDAVFLLQRREGHKLKIDRKNLEIKILK